MKVINARNVNDALQTAIGYLNAEGVYRNSRNGPVYLSPTPVTTVYREPAERVLFLPERDANPFFHLFESLWMLAGRNDIAPLVKIVKRMATFSDDGVTQHGAYGHRWRQHFIVRDQLNLIIDALRKNPDDRRCVLEMWDANVDLGRMGKDVPCNLTATFQINCDGALDLTVFCRSNDIIWGAYGANAVHFSYLLEYMAIAIGVPMGRYYQVSVNWHGYLETFEPLIETAYGGDPYMRGEVTRVPMGSSQEEIDEVVAYAMCFGDGIWRRPAIRTPFITLVSYMLAAQQHFAEYPAPERYSNALQQLHIAEEEVGPSNDWLRAGREWIVRRQLTWERKMTHGNQIQA